METINLTQLAKYYGKEDRAGSISPLSEDLDIEKTHLQQIDLSHEFSALSAALKVILIETIEFMDKLINVDLDQKEQKSIAKDIDRNILFAHLMISMNQESDLNDQFMTSLNKIDVAWSASSRETKEMQSLRKFERSFQATPFIFHGLHKEALDNGSYKSEFTYLTDESDFDDQGLSNFISLLFDAYRLSDEKFPYIDSYTLDARLISQEGLFDHVGIQNLELKGDADFGVNRNKIAVTLSKVLTEYFSSNLSVRDVLLNFLEQRDLRTDQAALTYHHINEKHKSNVEKVS